ncbi:DUF7370 family protein [Pseudomonas citronellolis]|uniref:DUF7370 family protein n=1 Tax=Pseudomonas citronellolis TaxID=53408 RepID=UPI002D7676C1|nr:hypothetical protein [Pseudomonas citronellolis]WRT83470.1 hypothetical protein VK748_03320 [Pseudomonas citronellolis]
MLTTDQAKEYLASVGITLPDFLVDLLVGQANSINDCLAEHYDSATATLIQLYLVGLLALAQGDKYISSQTAPSGASRSFRYQGFADRWKGTLNLLRGLDKYGCASELIPADPTQTAHGGLWIASAGCMCED